MITLKEMNKSIDEPLTDTKEGMIDGSSHLNDLEDEKTYWLSIIFIIYMFIDYDTHKLWESFTEEVKSNNRFFPESELLKKIEEISKKATCIINKGEILYRAREYTQKEFLNNDIILSVAEVLKEELSELRFEREDILNESAMNIAMISMCSNEEKYEKFIAKINNILKEKTSFCGFDRSNSDAPPCDYAKEGRANPKGISYLYTAQDIKTAILEMRPQMQKMYNIATVELIKDARIFDFTYSPAEIQNGEYSIVAELHRISEEFSKPNFGDALEYVPTQFICEFIKHLGYDGIKYKSAVSNTGTNILFFDVNESSRAYDITGSKVYVVDSLDVNISQLIPDGE